MPLKIRVRNILRAGLLVLFLFSTAMSLRRLYISRRGQDIYMDACELAFSPARETEAAAEPGELGETIAAEEYWVPEPVEGDAELEALEEINLAALQAVNPDVVGWIRIPESKVDYPIVQGTDNEYYLKVTWDAKRYAMGSIVLECTNRRDMTQFHTILYGHNMNDGSMFASVRKYAWEEYWKEHPYVYIVTGEGCFRYEVFSSYQAKADSNTYALEFTPTWGQEEYIQMALRESKIDTGIVPEPTDRILTLSTCSGGYSTRWVVHARLKMTLMEETIPSPK